MNEISLVQLMRGAFSAAKLYRGIAGGLYVGVILAGVTNTFLAALQVDFLWLPFVAGLLGVLAFISGHIGQMERSKAEKLREKVLYVDSLGAIPTPNERADLYAEATWLTKRYAREANSDTYFDSEKPQGAKRLLDNIRESMFWSEHLARTAKTVYTGLTVVAFVIGIIALIVAATVIDTQEIEIAVAQAAVSVILLGATGAPLKDVWAFDRVAQICRLLCTRADHLMDQEVDLVDAMQVVHEYGYALQGSPPLPEWIYNWRRDELNRLWEQRIQSG